MTLRRVALASLVLFAPVTAHGQWLPRWLHGVEVHGGGATVEHRITGDREVERTAGMVWSAGVSVRPRPWLLVRADLTGGELSARTPDAEARRIDQAELTATAWAADWLAIDVGTTVRSHTSPLARQRWTTVRTGILSALDLHEGRIRGIVRFGILPLANVSGLPSPELAVSGGTSLVYAQGRLRAELSYELERYDFPQVVPDERSRLEQLSSLGIRFGWRLGR